MNIPTIVLVAGFLLIMASFWLGYDAADKTSRRIQKSLTSQLRLAQRQRHELSQWVRDNWPNEYAAYHSGIRTGYQQGLEQAHELIEEAEQRETT